VGNQKNKLVIYEGMGQSPERELFGEGIYEQNL
jgi:hypothetical protein